MGFDIADQLTEHDEEIAGILKEVGLKVNEATLLVIFLRKRNFTSRELERIADLRQPEVSIAINTLTKKRWIRVINQITEKKGRPVKLYQLSASIDDILDRMKDQIEQDYSKHIAYIERIRDLVKESGAKERREQIIEIDYEIEA